MPRIIFTDLDRKQTIELKDKLITIGRAPDNAIVLRDDSISSYHAVLKEKDGNYSLQDLDSTNGLKVDGHRVKSADLEDGTNLKLGDALGTYESEIHVPKTIAGPTADVPVEDDSSSNKLKLSDRKPVNSREEADVSKPTKDIERSKSKSPPPAVKRSKQIAKPKKSKKGSGCGLLLFTVLALLAPFAGMAFRHYQDTNEWLPVQIWEKISGSDGKEKPKDG